MVEILLDFEMTFQEYGIALFKVTFWLVDLISENVLDSFVFKLITCSSYVSVFAPAAHVKVSSDWVAETETPVSQVLFFSGKDKVAAVGALTVGVGAGAGAGVGAGAVSPPPEQAAKTSKQMKVRNLFKRVMLLLD